MESAPRWAIALQLRTEQFLTWRRRRHLRRKERQRKKHVIVDWLEAFLWAAGVVLLINQYLLQAYQIPSGSMMNTLLLGDRIFVNKLIYGPELLPGVLKLPGFTEAKRGEVMIFENPSYISRGTAFDIVQRILYMVTLSLVDIDRDESGEPRAHFLIKRVVGVAGDRFRTRQGDLEILAAGTGGWRAERDFFESAGLDYHVRRLVPAASYAFYPAAGEALAMQQLSLAVPEASATALRRVQAAGPVDPLELDYQRSHYLSGAAPHDARIGARVAYYELGWYVPEGRILPLGDNRDNSRDGRNFGPVRLDRVLGRAMFKYWPIPRLGAIR